MKLNYERFLKNRLVKEQRPDFEQIGYQIQRSLKDLKTAEANLSIDLTWSLKGLLKDAKEKRFGLVLVYKIDRFSRNLFWDCFRTLSFAMTLE